MKYSATFFSTALLFAACSNDNATSEKIREDIMTTHEKVMNTENKLMDNKILIDSLIKLNKFNGADPATIANEFAVAGKNLETADAAMDKWMNDYDAKQDGKTDAEKLQYLKQQRILLKDVDSAMNTAVAQSDKLLATYKK